MLAQGHVVFSHPVRPEVVNDYVITRLFHVLCVSNTRKDIYLK